MRKLLLVLLLVLAAALLPAGGLAAGETYVCGDFRYALTEDGGACLLNYIGSAEAVCIPASLDGHPVTAVQGNPFCEMRDFAWRLRDCEVTVEEGHPYLEVIDGVLFGKTDHRLIWCPRALAGERYAVPEGTEIIGRHAFYACAGLREVTLPESVTVIENHAFRACLSLTALGLPQGLTAIGDCAFLGCRSLETLTLPGGLTEIGWHAFGTCPLLTLTVTVGSPAHAHCAEEGLPWVAAE